MDRGKLLEKLNICFDEIIKEFDFIKNEDEPCVYKEHYDILSNTY